MKPAIYLTRRAAYDLREIHAYSSRKWGEQTASQYVSDLYAAFAAAAANPESGILRQHRSTPFLMVSARSHFVIFERLETGIVILTLLHQTRDIEKWITHLTPDFLREVSALRARD